jgi:RNA polymerase-binding transcription factor DksA
MDERLFERAAAREESERQAGVEAAAATARPESHPEFDGQNCVECDNPIPQLRLAMGKVRCVFCQTTKERLNAHTRK